MADVFSGEAARRPLIYREGGFSAVARGSYGRPFEYVQGVLHTPDDGLEPSDEQCRHALILEAYPASQLEDLALFAAYTVLKRGQDVSIEFQDVHYDMTAGMAFASEPLARKEAIRTLRRFRTISGAEGLSRQDKLRAGAMVRAVLNAWSRS